jgi:Protein of unknown function (DUF4236)/Staphylococcal nuclease homologue
MGWFLRKSVTLGSVRLNLSKSGLGASVGGASMCPRHTAGWLASLLVLFAVTPTMVPAIEPTVQAQVFRAIDGDTIQVRIGDRTELVRYIGIDTPKLHHPTRGRQPFGEQALAANRALVEGQTVTLVFDTILVGRRPVTESSVTPDLMRRMREWRQLQSEYSINANERGRTWLHIGNPRSNLVDPL